ncbi:uncharacterized protein LOC110634058 [Hevea brasiliensis]|uniref:uncharacterized protein LOC110634058 n=1 Tax=Hevea brasiliensis TaxID=3981 RepID=UPI0025D5DAB1|nr:uncharacterized protein LOC110634058 [Hevea brasiliensis]
MQMEATLCCFVLALQIVSFVSGTSRPFASNDVVGVNQPGQSSESLQVLLGSNSGSQMGSKQALFLSPMLCKCYVRFTFIGAWISVNKKNLELWFLFEMFNHPLQDIEGLGEVAGFNKEACSKGLNKIGSSPPSCEHKCFGCTPCEAIQVPTTSKTHYHLGVNYANYEPEGWKCKCGPSFYSP